MEYLVEFIDAVMDSLEECFETFTVPQGKRLIYVLYVTIGFLVLSIFLQIVNYKSFISWLEALIAVLIMLCIVSIDNVNKSSIEKVKRLLNEKRVEERNGKRK